MAAPSAPNVYIGGNHKWGSDGVAAITTTPSESVTKVTAIISQTSGGAAIETVETSTKTSSDQFADRWALSWPTEDITSSPYYVRVRSTNADGNGPFKEIAPYIYFPPTVAITAPVNGSTLASASVTMAWTASDPYGISAQRVTVLHGADVLLDETVSESATSYAVPSSVAFLDGESYTFRVTARNGNGMEASADSTCAFSFDAPAAASVTIADDGATATIAVDDPHYSESGAAISVDGSAIADSFTVFGKSTQDGTPTPSAPVAIESIESRNLIPPRVMTYTTNGITFTMNESGEISVTGTATAQADFPISNAGNNINPITVPAGQYTFSATGVQSGIHIITSGGGQNGFPYTDLTTDKAASGDVTDGTKPFNYVIVRVASGTVADATVRIQLEEGGFATPYEPYGHVIVHAGSNMLDFGSWTGSYSGAYFTEFTASSNLDSNRHLSPVVLEEGVTYTLSMNIESSVYPMYFSVGAGNGAYSRDVASTPQITQAGRYSRTFTVTSTHLQSGSILAFRAPRYNAATTYTATISDVQLEIGSTATPYQPYEGTTYPIDLQGNSLCSLPDGTRDELRVGERKVLAKRVQRLYFDGSDMTGWAVQGSYASSGGGYYFYTNPDNDSTVTLTTNNVRTNRLTWTSGGLSVSANNTGKVGYANNPHFFRIRPEETTAAQTLSALQTWLQSNPLEVLLPLATTQEIDLGAASDYPFIPEDGEMWVDGTEMEVVLRPADYAGQPPISSVDIARVNPDGTWTLAQGVTEGQSAIDPLPPLGVPYRYALTSHAAGGGTKVAYVEHTVETRAWHLNFGDAAQEHVSYLYNPQATMTLAQGGESYHFADGGAGRGLPVFYPTTDRDMSGTLRFDTVLYGDSDILLDLCDRYPVAWLRDPFGHRWRAHVRPSVSHGTGQVWPVTIAWDAVRFEEV